MLSGIAEQAFGQAEIDIMRRAMDIATRSLRLEQAGDMSVSLRLVARSILRQTSLGQTDPLIIGAQALREQKTARLQTFQPYERRSRPRRTHARNSAHAPHSRKIA